MKLDARNIRHLSPEDWRVLTAVEQGTRNHEVVPTSLIASISALPSSRSSTSGGIARNLSHLAKFNLIARTQNARYDGYRLTYGGLDYLALHAHVKSNALFSVGHRIGVGKEADVVVCAAPPIIDVRDEGADVDDSVSVMGTKREGAKLVLKMHRLGRISFRTVKQNRDYLGRRRTGNWMYLSRLAAQKEAAVLNALHSADFPVPRPRGWNRHTLLMELVDGTPLRSIAQVPDPGSLYSDLIMIIIRLAQYGLIHGDYNEFNILISERAKENGEIELIPTIIDFPQAVSTSHSNAKEYFDRDVSCIKRFFERRFSFIVEEKGPTFEEAIKEPDARRLDTEVEASGFNRKMSNELQKYIEENQINNEEDEFRDDNEQNYQIEDDNGKQDDQIENEQLHIISGDRSSENQDTLSNWIDNVSREYISSQQIQNLMRDSTLTKVPDTVEKETQSMLNRKNKVIAPSVAASVRTTSSKIVNPLKAQKGWAL